MTEETKIASATRDLIEAMQDYQDPDAVILDRLKMEGDKPTFTAFHEGEQYRITVEKVKA